MLIKLDEVNEVNEATKVIMKTTRRFIPMQSTRGKYKQGVYIPKKPEKWILGGKQIVYRSSYEYHFNVFCDESDFITKVTSETIEIISGETEACVVLSEFPPTISLGFNCRRFCF